VDNFLTHTVHNASKTVFLVARGSPHGGGGCAVVRLALWLIRPSAKYCQKVQPFGQDATMLGSTDRQTETDRQADRQADRRQTNRRICDDISRTSCISVCLKVVWLCSIRRHLQQSSMFVN